ncbi:hypothetical protein [Pedobacter xixiisoli]|uniref:Lipoprotein n=1 Tax=Pedobacter xixiisoli TaxID=1476464 RepID=A0A286A8Y6_9SPHI|nr:hypothetical protein [Pedobacter xixiisoli]SOD18376.1 hypothetical protein SAMN06297358_2968 [Pedobacter xixiisoli]
MKAIKYIIAAAIISIYACNDTSGDGDEAVEVGSEDTTVMAKVDTAYAKPPLAQMPAEEPEEVRINYYDSLNFERYKVDAQKIPVHAPIDWTSYPEAKDFRTRIIEAYKTDEVDFAGYYVMSIFGCGAGCIMGFMVDVRDGKIYDLPLGEENSCLFAEDRAMGNLKSRLFIASICKEKLEDKKVYYKAYLWNEDKKEFEEVEKAAILKN